MSAGKPPAAGGILDILSVTKYSEAIVYTALIPSVYYTKLGKDPLTMELIHEFYVSVHSASK